MSTATKAPAKSEKPRHAAEPSRAHAQSKVLANPVTGSLESVQQSAGNLAIQHLLNAGAIKAKLSISQPNHPDEQEADAMADRIMRMTDIDATKPPCPTCATGTIPCPTCSGEQSKVIRRKASGNSGNHANSSIHQILGRPGSGHPLDQSTRTFFEPRLGADLSHVRLHTDSAAAESAKSIQAKAYTLGSDIAFAPNQFAPGMPDGQRLLAHELTHVIQQSETGSAHRIARDLDAPSPPVDPTTKTPQMPSQKPAVLPLGRPMLFEGVLLGTNKEYVAPIMRAYIAGHGEDEAKEFRRRLRRHVDKRISDSDRASLNAIEGIKACPVDTLSNDAMIYVAVNESLEELLESNKKWLADFEVKAKDVVLGMLDESEERVNQERIRYGVSWKGETLYTETGSYEYFDYSMKDTPASRALAEAATGLLKRKRTFDEAHKNMEEFGRKQVQGNIGELARQRYGSQKDQEDLDHLNELRRIRSHAKRDLDVFGSQKTAEFPILAAYASEEQISENSLEKLEQLAAGKSPTATSMIGEEIKSRLEHIAEVRKDIRDNNGKETKIWRVPRIIEGTRGVMGAAPGTMYGRLVDDKVKDEAPGIWTSILIGLLQLVLVLLAPATGGLSLIPAAAIGVAQAYTEFREYERAQMLRGTDFGAMALSSEDPSLFWLAVSIIGAGFDVGAAAGAATRLFRALAPAARAARAAKAAEATAKTAGEAAKAAETTEVAIRNLERTASELGGEALAKTVGRDARAGSDAMRVGQTAEEAKALERAGQQLAEQELRVSAAEAESIAGRMVKVSESGSLWSCASPCTLMRERYSGLLQRKGTSWEARLNSLEEEAAKIPKGKEGAAARKQLADRAAVLEREMRTTAMPGEWTSPLKDTDEFKELLKRRGSVAAELDHHPPGWTGKDEARFRYGEKIDPEPGYRWTLDENGALRYDRLDAALPARRYNPAIGMFEEAAESSTLIKATKGAEETREFAKIPETQRKAMEKAFKKRGNLIAERDRLEALQEAGKIGQKDSDRLRKVYAEINEQSRQLGENAADAVMKGKGGKKIYPSGKPYSTSGDFDQVWKSGDRFQIVEAKGGASGLGSRAISEGIRAEQGTIEYAKSIAQNMAKNGATPEIRKLGRDLLMAIADGKVDYILVRAPIGEELGKAVISDVKVSQFVLK